MKKIVRLSENDLSRLIRKVLKESESQLIKARVFNAKDDIKNNVPRACNIDITEVKLKGNGVQFFYEIPGGAVFCNVGGVKIPNQAYGFARCGDNNYQVKIEGTQGYLSQESYKKLTVACDSYASAGNKEDSNYA